MKSLPLTGMILVTMLLPNMPVPSYSVVENPLALIDSTKDRFRAMDAPHVGNKLK